MPEKSPKNQHLSRLAAAAAGVALLAAGATHADAALVRVNLGIFGGQANDLAAYRDSGGTTRLLAAVRGDIGIVRLNNAGSRWDPGFYGRPGEVRQVEADITDGAVGTGAGVVYALLQDGKLVANNSDQSGTWTRAAWATVTNGGVFVSGSTVVEGISAVEGHSSGLYVGTFNGNIYRSTDGGGTFALLGTPVSGGRVESIAVYVDDATNPSIWTTVDNTGTRELYPLTYGGSAYTVGGVMTVTGSPVIEQVHVYPDTGITDAPLLFVTGDSPSQSVYRGANASTWTTVTEPLHYFQDMVFDQPNAMIFAVSGYSTDLGQTFTTFPNFIRTQGNIHPNDSPMVLDPNNSGRVLAGSDWFIGDWSGSGSSWTANGEIANNDGVAAVIINDMDQIPDTTTTKDTFAIVGKSGIGLTEDFLSHSGAHPTWHYPIYPNSDGAPVESVRLMDTDGNGVIDRTIVGNNGGKIYRATSNGSSVAGTLAADYTMVFDAASDAVGFFADANRVAVEDIVDGGGTTSATQDDLWAAFGDWDTGMVGGGIACSSDNGVTWQMEDGWVTLADSMKVNSLLYTSTRFWAGVGKDDDSDPNHRGLYTKNGTLVTCGSGSGTWVQHSSGTTMDSAVVNDVDGNTSNRTYVAASTGLYYGVNSSGWTWQELTGSADPQLSKLPLGEYRAVTHNPAPPSAFDEEFYGAISDEIYRIRLAGTTWTVDLISPTPHEEVNVLLYDDLVVGSAGSVTALGIPSKAIQNCRKTVRKVRTGYFGKAMKALVYCRDKYVTGSIASCPDASTQAKIAKASVRFDFTKKCSDEIVAALTDTWWGKCNGVSTAEDLAACMLADTDEAINDMIELEYGEEALGRVGTEVACQQGIGRAYGKTSMAKALKALDKCDDSVDKGKAASCPDAKAVSALAKVMSKAEKTIAQRCTDSAVAALDALGFGGTCSGSSTVAELQSCMSTDHQAALTAMQEMEADNFVVTGP